MTLFHMNQCHADEIRLEFGFSESDINFNSITLINMEQGHTIMDRTIAYACQAKFHTVGTVALETVIIMLSHFSTWITFRKFCKNKTF